MSQHNHENPFNIVFLSDHYRTFYHSRVDLDMMLESSSVHALVRGFIFFKFLLQLLTSSSSCYLSWTSLASSMIYIWRAWIQTWSAILRFECDDMLIQKYIDNEWIHYTSEKDQRRNIGYRTVAVCSGEAKVYAACMTARQATRMTSMVKEQAINLDAMGLQ